MLRKIFLLLFCLLLFTIAYAQQSSPASAPQPMPSTQSSPESISKTAVITYNIIEVENHTYGYDVFADGKLSIHQNSIPAVQGNKGFETKADAEKVAQLVISKIRKGEMPPTVTIDELKKLKVIK
jgi:Domain of unknown function (DUF4907)